MRFVLIAVLALSVVGCTRWSMNHHLNNAYSAYERGNCEQVMLELSKVERASRARPYVWPEVSMMRGQCLERQKNVCRRGPDLPVHHRLVPAERIRVSRPCPPGNLAEPGALPDSQCGGGAPDPVLIEAAG